MNTCLFCFFLVLFALEGVSSGGNRAALLALDATEADFSQFSHHTAIQYYTESFEPRCGGSLINDRWILTSARCFENDNRLGWLLKNLRIIAGNNGLVTFDETAELNATLKEKNVRDQFHVIIHPDYKIRSKHFFRGNIAIVKLAKGYNLAEIGVTPIKPMIRSELGGKDSFNAEAVVTGHGTKGSNTLGVEKLMQTNLTIISNFTECRVQGSFIKEGTYLTETDGDKMVCLKMTGSQLLCDGDLGGGVVGKDLATDKLKLIAVIVYGARSVRKNCFEKYMVATRVDSYLEWIEEMIQKYDQVDISSIINPTTIPTTKAE